MRSREKTRFQKTVWAYYKTHKRDFPWRKTRDPYKILVSEIMLQQTQVARVVQKYKEFIRAFPTVRALANAPVRDVLSRWQGLGYNRRALSLKKTAEILASEHGRKVPKDPDLLHTLPGIGPATAASISAFAFNTPTVFIETNIRSVFLFHFFTRKVQKDTALRISDKEILPLVAGACDDANPREWYWALMDYGAMIKETYGNPNKISAGYRKQSRFTGSQRQLRGAIIRTLLQQRRVRDNKIPCILRAHKKKVALCLSALEHEGLLKKEGPHYVIAP